jgi:hypothetical protein
VFVCRYASSRKLISNEFEIFGLRVKSLVEFDFVSFLSNISSALRELKSNLFHFLALKNRLLMKRT